MIALDHGTVALLHGHPAAQDGDPAGSLFLNGMAALSGPTH
ncbi:hypothetical protein [Amycolatopsis jejuensis]|nr:hypothetical protein [Amycolatopsis jejuensis]